MSNKITKTVTYEIEPSGDCRKCDNWIFTGQHGQDVECIVFREDLGEVDRFSQCQACKEYLEAEKAKVYCDGCKHKNYPNLSENFYCWKNKDILFENGKPYSLNCIDWEKKCKLMYH